MQELITVKTVQISWPRAKLWISSFEIFVKLLLLLGSFAIRLLQKKRHLTQLNYRKRSTTNTETCLPNLKNRSSTTNIYGNPKTHAHTHSSFILCPDMVVLVTASALHSSDWCLWVIGFLKSRRGQQQLYSSGIARGGELQIKKKDSKDDVSFFKYYSFTNILFPTAQTYMGQLSHIPQSGSGAD